MENALAIVVFAMSAIVLPTGAWAINRIIWHDQWLALQAQKLNHIQERLDEIYKFLKEHKNNDELL